MMFFGVEGYLFLNSIFIAGFEVRGEEVNDATYLWIQVVIVALLYIGSSLVEEPEMKLISQKHFKRKNPIQFAISVVDMML